MTRSTTMTSKGQVTIPVDIRRKLGLKAGQSIRFRFTKSNRIIIEKNDWKHGLGELHKEVASHLKRRGIKPLTDEELDDVINQSAEQAAQERYNRSLEI